MHIHCFKIFFIFSLCCSMQVCRSLHQHQFLCVGPLHGVKALYHIQQHNQHLHQCRLHWLKQLFPATWPKKVKTVKYTSCAISFLHTHSYTYIKNTHTYIYIYIYKLYVFFKLCSMTFYRHHMQSLVLPVPVPVYLLHRLMALYHLLQHNQHLQLLHQWRLHRQMNLYLATCKILAAGTALFIKEF